MKRIYLAGGWFTPEQEEQHTRIYNLLKDAFDVFNPRIAGEINSDTSSDKMTKILLGNVDAIRSSDLVVVLYDYRDTGTIWESGYAYANCIPIIYFAEHLNGKRFNLMLAKTGRFSSNEEDLLKKLNESDSYDFYITRNEYSGEIE